jgi:hypothetical protein
MAGKWRQDNPFEEVEIEVNPFSVGISLLDRHADLIYLQLKQLCNLKIVMRICSTYPVLCFEFFLSWTLVSLSQILKD